jgi:hypothetical protein
MFICVCVLICVLEYFERDGERPRDTQREGMHMEKTEHKYKNETSCQAYQVPLPC